MRQQTRFWVTGLVLSGLLFGASAPGASAATPSTLCPREVGVVPYIDYTNGDDYDPVALAANPVQNLVGCVNPYIPELYQNVLGNNQQTQKTVGLDFGPIPSSAFDANNTFTIRVSGTYGNGGYVVNVRVDKNTRQTSSTSPSYVSRYQCLFFPGSNTAGSGTADCPIQVIDPDKREKLLAGDYAITIWGVGGYGGGINPQGQSIAGSPTESIASVSIPYTAYDLNFDANGGSGTLASRQSGFSTNLPVSPMTRTGYTFVGWNTIADGSGTAFADQAAYPFASDQTLYAQWAAELLPPAASTVDTYTNDTLATTGAPNRTPVALAGGFLVLAGLALALLAVVRRRAKEQ